MFRFPQTVTARLTLLFIGLYALLAAIMFFWVGHGLSKRLMARIDAELLHWSKSTVSYVHANYDDDDDDFDLGDIRRYFRDFTDNRGAGNIFVVLLSRNQREVMTSDLSEWRGLPFTFTELDSLPENEVIYKTLESPDRANRIRVIYEKSHDGFIVETGLLLDDYQAVMDHYRTIFVSTAAIMLLAGGLFGFVIARRAMSGVERVTQTAAYIGRGDLSRRVPAGREGLEIERLALAFNNMLERIQGLVAELREVTNNIAHDLRSPITRMRGIAETTLTGDQEITEYREMTGMIIEESDRMVSMINTMLEIAAADAGVDILEMSELDLAEVVRNACDLFEPVAEDAGISLSLAGADEPVFIRGNESRLQRVIANLLDNAIKFTDPDGSVMLEISVDDDYANVTVSDTGQGISPDDMNHIFERFYRGDRSRSLPGNGLGLSFAQSIVNAHGGAISVTSQIDEGSAFTVRIPRT